MTKIDARQLVDKVLENFKTEGTCYKEYFPASPQDRESCYLFSYFATTGMLYYAIKTGHDVKQQFKNLIDGFAYYRSNALPNNMIKYHSERGNEPNKGCGPCFFDDNIWTARNMLFAYEVLGSEKYLDEAKRINNFVLSGWNSRLGGLVWNENGLSDDATVQELERGLSANACSALVNAILYQLTNQEEYLIWAQKFYTFCKQTQDEKSKIYYNGIHTVIENGVRKSGKVNKDLYSYNAGSMVLANLKLFEITKDEKYFKDAQQSSKAAYKVFIQKDSASGELYAKDFIWFAAIMVECWQALSEAGSLPEKEYLAIMQRCLDYSAKYKNQYGLLPHDTVCGWRKNDAYDRMLLTHSALAEIAVITQTIK